MWREDHLHGDLFSEAPKLGPGLTSTWPPEHLLDQPLDDIEEDQNLNAKFALSGKQRELLKTGFVENRSTRNDEVLKKRDKLPERIQHLTEDIALLYFQSLLSPENWEHGTIPEENRITETSNHYELAKQADPETGTVDGDVGDSQQDRYETPFDSPDDLWEDLIETPRITQHIRDDVFFHGNPVISKETQFGFEIGNVLRLLRPDDYDSYFQNRWEYDGEIIGPGLMWGFILAFLGQSQENLKEERDQLDEFCELLIKLQDARIKEANRMPSTDEIRNDQYEEVTKEAVEEIGLTPHHIILREVEYHCPIVDDDDADDETKKAASVKVVEDITEITPLREVDSLRQSLEQDLNAVRERSRPGVDSARNVLEGVWMLHTSNGTLREENAGETNDSQMDSPEDEGTSSHEMEITSASIGEEINQAQNIVSEILNRLSDDDGSSLWTNEAIVSKDTRSRRGTKWEPTAYGTLLCELSFERSEDTDWLYHYALGPEELSLRERKQILEALDQVGFIDVS